jgi:hypothetical protein
LPVAVAIALIAIVAFLTSRESAVEVRLGANEMTSTRAEFVSQAGLQHAMRNLAQQGCGPYADLTNVSLGSAQYSAVATTGLGSTVMHTLAVDQDSWIDEGQPGDSNGNDNSLSVGFDGSDESRALLRFDLSSIPAGSSVLSATAWFYIAGAHPEGAIDLHRISADWDEGMATWHELGDSFYGDVIASIPAQNTAAKWVALNLTAQAQAWVNGEDNHGIALRSMLAGLTASYASSESSEAPYLKLVVGSVPTLPGSLNVIGTLANGVSHDITRDQVRLRQQPASNLESRLGGASGKDAMLDSSFSNRNYGDHELGLSSNPSWLLSSLLYFEITALPPDAIVDSAELMLYHKNTTSSGASPGGQVFRVTRDWIEGKQGGAGAADGATWDTWNGIDNWTAAGGDFDAQAIAATGISTSASDWESWEIKSLVQGWISGRYANQGRLLKASGDIHAAFASGEDADPSLRPRLSFRFSCQCGQVCVAYQGKGKIMMVVANAINLSADDAYIKSLFESWGYQVTPIRDNENGAGYESLAADSDVVFISESVDDANVGNKLVGLAVGIVSQDGIYNPDLGIASSQAWPVATGIDVTDSSHYITAPFATGPLELFNAPMEQLSASGANAPGLQSLAKTLGNSSLATLEPGSALHGGGSARGRRVMLPLGRGGKFNWSQLNSNGRLVVQRALTWASSLDVISKDLLMVATNPSSLTPQETERRQLFESWGYTVNLIDQSDSQADFDNAVSLNPVAYVSEEIDPAELTGKLNDTIIGVVNEDAGMVADFALSQNHLLQNLTQVDITDNSHYITEPFAIGLLNFVDSSQSVHMLTGASAGGLWTLGQGFDGIGNWEPSLAVMETGGILWGGGSASGRRVQLPWGGDSFDVGQLNDDGRTIMRRAIEWASTELGGGPPFAHWKLDESGGKAALDSIATHHGKLSSGPSWSMGLVDGALEFDGVDDRVDIDATTGLDNLFEGGATLSGWIYASGWGEGGFGRIADKANAENPASGWQLGLDGADQALNFEVGFSGSTGRWASPDGSIKLNTWHHVTLVYNSKSTLNDPVFYIDGLVQPLIENAAPSGTVSPDQVHDLTLGNHSEASSRSFDGRLDDIRLYDRLLSASQVVELAQSPGPIAHWLLDDGAGNKAFDYAGGPDGKLEKGPVWVEGVLGGALQLDGKDTYVKADKFDVIGSGITMMGWFNATLLDNAEAGLISKADKVGDDKVWWQLGIVDDGADRYLASWVKAGGDTTRLEDASTGLVVDQWYHAAATYDSVSGTMRLYLDGVEVASRAHATGGDIDTDAKHEVALGANADKVNFFEGRLDDMRVYNYSLSDDQILAIYEDVEVPGLVNYYERVQTWQPQDKNSWEVVDLSVYGVPADAVAEIAILNKKDKEELWGGLRALGSVLDRRVQLNEAENKGFDTVTMHVQADANSLIEYYAEKDKEIRFVLLGYWTGASYSEMFSSFSASASNAWVAEDVADDGLGANLVAEILIRNTSESSESLAGFRRQGSVQERSFELKEAEAGGVDALTMMVNTGAAASIEVFAESNADVDFQVLGYWSSPPGTYTEIGGSSGQVSTDATWKTTDVSGFGIAAGAVAQFVIVNNSDDSKNKLGLREYESSQVRVIELQEAESGGSDLGSMHVNVDDETRLEWYAQSGDTDNFFYPVGWWDL